MFDFIGWSELLIIAVVAIIVVGPRELPALLRTIGKTMGQLKRTADDFRRQFDDALRETELDQMRQEFEKTASDISSDVKAPVSDFQRSMDDEFDEIERSFREQTSKSDAASKSHADKSASVAERAEQATEAHGERTTASFELSGDDTGTPDAEDNVTPLRKQA